MNWKDLMELVAIGQDEVGSLARQLGKAVAVDRKALVMLARMAIFQPDDEAGPGPAHHKSCPAR